MTERVMMILGDYEFSVDAAVYQEFQRSTVYRWASQERLNRAPALQFVGVGEDQINLNGVIYPHYKGGIDQIKTMRESAAKGESLTLVVAPSLTGEVLGEWCIMSITETQRLFFPGGVPKEMQFSISLSYYGEDLDGNVQN